MPLPKKIQRIGNITGLILALLIILIGVLFVTGVITYQVTNAVYGWTIIIIFAALILERLILKLSKIFN